jgi:hypothetical protein
MTWGYNGSGQLGHGKRTYENELLPKPVHKLTELISDFADGDFVEVREREDSGGGEREIEGERDREREKGQGGSSELIRLV